MKGLTSFFLFCAGANQSILKRTPTEINKYAGIGATVFFTGIFAAIAGGFALFSVFKSMPIAFFFGLIWGMLIFNLDRYIVMSIRKKDNPWNEFFTALPRIVLAVLIAFVIAKPLELELFSSEIDAELVLMEQEKYKEQEDVLLTRHMPEIDRLKEEVNLVTAEISELTQHKDELNMMAIQEADGTGGSGVKNLGPIYLAKKAEADAAEIVLNQRIGEVQPILNSKHELIANKEKEMQAELTALNQQPMDGFAAQMDALGRLGSKSSTIFYASIFITLLFIAIETSPLFVKLMTARSPYDFKLDQHELAFSESHARYAHKEKLDTKLKTAFDLEVGRQMNQQRMAAEKEIVENIIQTEKEKFLQGTTSWKDYRRAKGIFN